MLENRKKVIKKQKYCQKWEIVFTHLYLNLIYDNLFTLCYNIQYCEYYRGVESNTAYTRGLIDLII